MQCTHVGMQCFWDGICGCIGSWTHGDVDTWGLGHSGPWKHQAVDTYVSWTQRTVDTAGRGHIRVVDTAGRGYSGMEKPTVAIIRYASI